MKYYKVIKEHPVWQIGTILKKEEKLSQYNAIDEIYLKDIPGVNNSWGEGAALVENCPEWFQRVYKVDTLTKVVYEVKEKALELLQKNFKG